MGECEARRPQDRAHFLLYGILPPATHEPADTVHLPADAYGNSVITAIWGAYVKGFATTRSWLLNPRRAKAVHPRQAVRGAAASLRAAALLDHGHALRRYSPRAPTKYVILGDVVVESARAFSRPTTEADFNAKWRFLASSQGGRLSMLDELHAVLE